MAQFLQDTVINLLQSDSKYDYEGIYAQVSADYAGLEENAILEEIAAQYMGVVFANEKTVNKMVENASEKQKSILKKMLDYLKKFIKDLKGLIKVYASQDKTVRAAVETPLEDLEYMAQLLEEALSKTNKKTTVEDGGVKASRQFNDAEINNDIISLVNRVKENKFTPNEVVNFGTVNDKVAAEIMNLTGFDVSDYSVVVEARQIEHILKDHGENGKTDHSLRDTADIAKMGFVLNEPDSISNAGRTQAYSYMEKGHNRTAKTVLYEKRIGEKSYYVVQAVPVTKAKKVFVVSAFIGEQGYKKEVSQLINANSPDATTEYGSATLSNSSVTQNIHTVNKDDMQNSKKYSYAGIGAKTHNIKTLEQAIRLEDVGKATSEEIRQQTGWFRGYDGEWRFELDDSKAVFRTEGDVKLRQNERYRRLEELSDRYNNLNESEQKELSTLEKEFEDDIWSEKYELQDYLAHPALYEAYPQLKHLSVVFDILEPGVYGEYHRNKNTIVLRKGADSNLVKRALVHELQHAIQQMEDFADGSSPSYWSQVSPEQKPGTYAYMINERNKIGQKIIQTASPDFVQAFREYNRGELEYSELEKIGTEDELDILWEYDEADREASRLRENDRSDYNLYMSTAGEIEARDVAKRADYSAEERKHTRPDIDRTDVVFVEDNTVSYSIVEPFTDENGVEFKNAVLLDTDFFDGISPKNWGRKLKEYVTGRSKNNPFILPIVDEKGNMQQLQFAKVNERVKKDNTNSHIVINKLSSSSDNISKLSVVHIDEVVSISEEANPYFSDEHTHQWLDEHGWLHRTANVINARNGKIFNVMLDIAKTKDGRVILYATSGKIKEVGNANVSSLKIRGSRPNSNSNNSLSQNKYSVNKYSRQLINDSWEDIRTKMYENEVHEDIIEENIQSKIKPGSEYIYDRVDFYDIAKKYNLLDGEDVGGFKKNKYSDTEIVNIMENILVGISDGVIFPEARLERLTRMQEDILRSWYELKYRYCTGGVHTSCSNHCRKTRNSIKQSPSEEQFSEGDFVFFCCSFSCN